MRTAVNLMSGGMAVGAVANLLSGETSPFGRFSEPGRGGKPVDRTVMWPLMEAPSVVMPLIVWVFLPRRGVGFANKFLLGLFVGHYVHRAIVQPLANRIAGRTPRPIPLHIGLAAFAFCTFNGTAQALSLLGVASFRKETEFFSTENYRNFAAGRFALGTLIFVVGSAVNIISDYLEAPCRSTRLPLPLGLVP
eukprot:Polyplicarium_translucidae@DN2964_c0_g1_i4.p1